MLGFPLTLKGAARGWFGALQPGSIENCKELGRQFLTHFMASRRRRRPATYLLTLIQTEDESLKTYLTCFNKEHKMSELARKTPTTLH